MNKLKLISSPLANELGKSSQTQWERGRNSSEGGEAVQRLIISFPRQMEEKQGNVLLELIQYRVEGLGLWREGLALLDFQAEQRAPLLSCSHSLLSLSESILKSVDKEGLKM